MLDNRGGQDSLMNGLNQDQVVSPIHFDKDLPKLHSIREAAYAKLEHILEKKAPSIPMNMLCCTQTMNSPLKHRDRGFL